MSSFWRYRIRFSKRGTVRFISHRDLMDVFARAFRRAALPVRMSQGFNPRPRFSLPAPLSLGIEGLDEVLELDLSSELPAEEVAERLARELPEGIRVLQSEQPESTKRGRIVSTLYHVRGPLPSDAVERCTDAEELPATRREGTTVNIRPYLKSISPSEDGCDVEVLVTQKGSARPAEIVAALVGDRPALARDISLVRTAVNLAPL